MLDFHGYLKKEHEYEGTMHVYEKRWEVMNKAFQELEEHHLDAQVEWGGEYQEVITKLRICKADLMVAIQQMLERKKNPRELGLTNAEKRAEERSVLYWHGDDSDKFTLQINEAVKEFDAWLRPHIKR